MPDAPLPAPPPGAGARFPRPVVGVTSALEDVRHGAWQHPAHVVPAAYVAAVHRAGGRAVLLPVDRADAGEGPPEALDGLDGLILIGGADLDPRSYGAERHPETAGDSELRDRFELVLVRGAQARDLPLLAICRGLQIAAAADGGTLVQHLPERVGGEHHRRVLGTLDERNAHEVRLTPGSLAARAAGGTARSVRSHHHQAVDVVPDGWSVTGRAVPDDVVEALERPDRAFCLAVQWHPEGDERSTVIAALVAAAAARRAATAAR